MEIGTKVKMINCFEANRNPDKVWVTRSEPWVLGSGEKIVLLEGKAGGFSVDCLEELDICPMCKKVIDSDNETTEEVMYDDICSDCEGEIHTANRI